jgi:hypothetical protein
MGSPIDPVIMQSWGSSGVRPGGEIGSLRAGRLLGSFTDVPGLVALGVFNQLRAMRHPVMRSPTEPSRAHSSVSLCEEPASVRHQADLWRGGGPQGPYTGTPRLVLWGVFRRMRSTRWPLVCSPIDPLKIGSLVADPDVIFGSRKGFRWATGSLATAHTYRWSVGCSPGVVLLRKVDKTAPLV